MATRKKNGPSGAGTNAPRASGTPRANGKSAAASSAHSTVSGPSMDDAPARAADLLLKKHRGTETIAASFSHNVNKRAEYGEATAVPPQGDNRDADDPLATASTVTESQQSPKTGTGVPPSGFNPTN